MTAKKKATTRTPRKTKPEKVAGVVIPHLTQMEAAFCHFLIQGKTPHEAAERMGMSATEGDAYFGRKAVKQYLEQYRGVFMQMMAQAEVTSLLRKGVTRESLADILMGLAIMPPERTKGSIEGQVKAVQAVETLLGLKFDPKDLPGKLRDMTDAQLAHLSGGGTVQ